MADACAPERSFNIFATLSHGRLDKLAIRGPLPLTYAELDARSAALMAAMAAAGAGQGDRVAMQLPRGPEALASMLAAARLGAAYVPIDPALPEHARIALLADAAPALLLTDRDVPGPSPRTLRLDQPLPPAPPVADAAFDPERPAYVMYTSGSTGQPKGVVTPWRGVLRLVQAPDYVSLGADEVILHAAPLGFDAATFEVWGALLNGASLAIVPDEVPSLDAIADAIARHGVTTAWLTSGLFHAMVDSRLASLRPLRQLLAGGDVLSPPHVARALAGLPETVLINGYGPTENTTFTCCHCIARDHAADVPVPIGRPIRGTTVTILDEDGRPVPPGEEGELCAGGAGVALGYLNRPDQTARAFRPGPDGALLYHTGDRARLLPDGSVVFAGRNDRQVKVAGKRVALDEVEGELRREPGVREAAVSLREGRLVAHVTGAVEAAALRRALAARLAPHMVPASLTVLGAMPLTANGKLDRRALPDTARRLAEIWQAVLGSVPEGNLFDAGATSLDVVRAHAAMVDAGFRLSLPDLFAQPSIPALAAYLDGAAQPAPLQTTQRDDAIAIIGIAARFPGADGPDAFWRNLCEGVESITRFAPDELEDGPPADPALIPARPILDGIDQFDPAFFHMTRRDAELTDPQHRVFLELAWEALETAGHDPARHAGRVGVWAGASPNAYLLRHVLPDRAAVLRYTADYQTGSYPALLGAGADFLATRIAYKLDLRGPALTVSTACSTALVAIAQACAALRAGEADMALAGGVSITLPQRRAYRHEPDGLASADGHVRPYDAGASGTVFGSGAGVVLLKRLAEAMAEGDHIHAVIAGIATNNDGAGKVGFTAPSVGGQADCIAAAQAQAGVAPAAVGYVEGHGTATPLGDPIEVAALRQVWGEAGSAVLGSVKGNVGHLDAAAGAAGLIKAALAVERGVLPGTLHFQAPNPAMALGPFRVTAQTELWAGTQPRIAGVSAFGVGGTNAHAVLRQAPTLPEAPPARASQVLVLSARSEAGLAEAKTRLAAHLASHPELALASLAWSSQRRRRFSHRLALAATSHADAIAALEDGRAATGRGDGGPVAFLFPGQGAQHDGMGRALYAAEPAFRTAIDDCAAILGRDPLAGSLAGTAAAQPALFAMGWGLAALWRSWGITPAASLGHSVGEFVAAALAGVFTLEDALRLVARRGALMGAMAPGAMLAVRLPEAELLPLLGEQLDLAAVNAPAACVAAGPHAAVEALEAALTGRGVMHRRLATSHAFHSRMMDDAVDGLGEAVAAIRLGTPGQPFVSSVTGSWITPEQATSPAYWAGHCRAPVRFAAALETLVASGPAVLLECGPGRTATMLALGGAARGRVAVPSLPEPGGDEPAALAAAAAQLAAAGVEPDWAALHGTPPRRAPLPPTPWEHVSCWIDSPEARPAARAESAPPMAPSESAAPALAELVALLEELSGERLAGVEPGTSFLQLGFDSLFLGQVAQQLRSRFGVSVTFRQLLGEYGTLGALANLLPARAPTPPPAAPAPVVAAASGELAGLLQQQVAAMSALFAQQLAAIGGTAPAAQPAPSPATQAAPPPENTARFDAFKVLASASTLTPAQQAHIDALVAATQARMPGSKRITGQSRRHLADPRAAAGFRPEWKEMTFPVVAVRSAGPLIWDADGNEYVDLVNGFGQTAFGHAPGFVTEAVRQQLERGFEIGPQAELAGRVATRFCAMTGNERMTFCNTGSEAVMAAMRVARTVTGRSRIATFAGSYHGQFDEVLIKAGPQGARAVAPGIPAESVANMVVLDYGSEAALDWLRAHAGELAAVIVEPVQSRHPALRPEAFLRTLREITAQHGAALVFDEVVTGFRTHPGGMQAVLGIRADLATYGKVVGGGLPIGVLAGRAAFMDALDGGDWQYGDASAPEAAVTFFAGTFVRHPLALAAMESVLTHIEQHGPAIHAELPARTAALAARMNDALAARGLPRCVEQFSSWFYFKLPDPLATLLYPHMRLRGVHIQEGFPCFLTTTHGEAEIARILAAFTASLDALQADGLLGGEAAPAAVQLTEAQLEVWLAAQLGDGASAAFNEGVRLELRGKLDVGSLREGLARLVARHDALRARFTPTGDRMLIGPAMPPDLVPEEGPLARVLEEEARTPFDLVAGPLCRARLVRLAPEHHVLVLTAHHIVCDGWSMNALLAELAQPGELPPARSFAAYADQQSSLRSEADLAWWRAQLASLPPELELPGDRARPPLRSFRGGTRQLRLSADALRGLRAAGSAAGCTLFATLLGGVSVLIGRLAGQQDVVVAVPAAAQSQIEDGVLVGHCANLLPLRCHWTEDMAAPTYLQAVRAAVLDAYEHQDCTLGTIVRALDLPRDTSRLPLTTVQFNLERLAEGMAMPGLELSVAANPKAFVNFDLFFNAVESKDGLLIDCDYNADLFDPETVDRWLGHLATLLDALAADPAIRLGDLPLLSPAEREAALHMPPPAALPDAPVHRLIARQAAARPEAVALRDGAAALSYAALEGWANATAQALLSRAAPSSRVAVMLERGAGLVAGLLGVWKAGMSYVPLDPSHPPARLQHVLQDSGAALLLGDGTGPALELAPLDLPPPGSMAAAPDAPALDEAYTIYTSGSTGLPKGVPIGHAALGNLLLSAGREPGIAPGDTWLAVTTIGFDIAGLEIWGPLVAGATVALAGKADVVDGHRLAALLADTGASIMQGTPGTWRLLLEAGWQPGAGLTMLVGGEALPRTLADRLTATGAPLWNMYGPTETTIWSALDRVGPGVITVGHPVANTSLRVLDAAGRLQPVGVPGELHIGGAGLTPGYLNRPELNAERFVADPFGPGRLYRTGDGARRLADGRVQVLGRLDTQLKLRGYRMEAGEIEHALAEAGARDAAVALRPGPGGEPRLVAWLAGPVPPEAALRERLGQSLPPYMVPSTFVTVPRLPLTPNGKVDRAALPDPLAEPHASPVLAEPPRTATERQLAEIWSTVLGRVVGRQDDLLVLGADSIQLFQITARASAAGLAVRAQDLLRHRTVAAVAASLGDETPDPPAIPRLQAFRRDRRVAVGG